MPTVVLSLRTVPGTAHPVRVLVEGIDEALSVNTPHLDRLVIGRCHQSLAVVGESNAAYGGGVSFEHRRFSFPMTHTKNTVNLRPSLCPTALYCMCEPLAGLLNK